MHAFRVVGNHGDAAEEHDAFVFRGELLRLGGGASNHAETGAIVGGYAAQLFAFRGAMHVNVLRFGREVDRNAVTSFTSQCEEAVFSVAEYGRRTFFAEKPVLSSDSGVVVIHMALGFVANIAILSTGVYS